MLIQKLKRTYRKKRAVSPIIAAIILIALAVFAGAAVYIIVLPLLNPTTTTANITVVEGTDPAQVGVLANSSACTSCSKTITFSILVTSSGTKNTNFNVSSVSLSNSTKDFVSYSGSQLTIKTGSSGAVVTGATPLNAGQGVTLTISFTTSSLTWSTGKYQLSVDLSFGSPLSSSKYYTASGLTFSLS